MEYETIKISAEAAVFRVRLNRPAHANAINARMVKELHEVIDLAEREAEVRLVVLEAQGPIFCSGMDMQDYALGQVEGGEMRAGGETLLHLLRRFTTTSKVIVASVDGQVIAGGTCLVAASDIVLATPASTFQLTEALWGLVPALVAPFLIRRVGFQTAYRMAVTTLPLSAEAAQAAGMVDEITSDPGPALRALSLRLRRVAPDTLREIKGYFNNISILSDEIAESAVAEFARVMTSKRVRDNLREFITGGRVPWDGA